MDPADFDKKARKEREETDASLLAERDKTDTELAKAVTSLEQSADRVLEVARERAEAILDTARERSDRDMAAAGVVGQVRRAVQIERAAEDGAVAEERVVAGERLQGERDKTQRATAALLRLERDATDDGLLVERRRADEVLATRDDFLGMVSHDLRSMLSGIALSAQMLAKAVPPTVEGAAALKHSERIQRLAARMNRLVGDLLDVVSLEAGKLHITPSPVDVCQLVKEAADSFQPVFVAQGITLTSNIGPDAIVLECDHERIMQVLANLIGNALKFTGSGGHVEIFVARTESEVRFSVTDDGVGIPPDERIAIFERFRQVGTKDRRGLGLGLYIAKSIIDVHGGKIWMESRDGGGSTFHFTLPLVPPPGS